MIRNLRFMRWFMKHGFIKHGFIKYCSMKNRFKARSHNVQGFTLFEVMVALAVLSFSILALVKQANTSVQVTTAIKEKTLAFMLAENVIAELRMEEQWPENGNFEKEETMANRDWYIEWEVYDAPFYKNLRTVEVSVADKNSKEKKITTVTGIIGKH